jgi:hypothetical protein
MDFNTRAAAQAPRRAPRSLGVFPAGWRDVQYGEAVLLNESVAPRHHGRPGRREDPIHPGTARRWRDSPPPRPSTSLHARNNRTSSTRSPTGGARENQARLQRLQREEEARQRVACRDVRSFGRPSSLRHVPRAPARPPDTSCRSTNTYELRAVVVDCSD